MSKNQYRTLTKIVLGGLVATGATTALPAAADEIVDEGAGRNLVVFDDEGRMLVEGAVPSALFDDVIVRSVLVTGDDSATAINIIGCKVNTNCSCPKPTE